MLNCVLIVLLIAGLSLLVYIMNGMIIQRFEENKMKQAITMVYGTMFASLLIVMFIAFCFRIILIDIANIFYRT
ncbi:hypothetical protein ROU88_02835 [Macrococcus capreoli]